MSISQTHKIFMAEFVHEKIVRQLLTFGSVVEISNATACGGLLLIILRELNVGAFFVPCLHTLLAPSAFSGTFMKRTFGQKHLL